MLVLIYALIQIVFIVRVLLRPHRDPSSRVAWIAVILALPVVGLIAYLLLGETSIGRKRTEQLNKVIADLPALSSLPGHDAPNIQPKFHDRFTPLFKVGASISGFHPVGGNHAELMADSNSAIDQMVADIDAATDHVHLLFYIWMPDNNGTKIAQALIRAVARGVACRAMVDDLGSRLLIKSELWKQMSAAGVTLARALKIGNPLKRIVSGRIDLRNHRKILVIDNEITYCGSQNCADPEFLTKAKYAPWVDAVMRFTGPVVRQNQQLFASDWSTYQKEDLTPILTQPISPPATGFTAQVIGTGPAARAAATPELFASLLYSARDKVVITTPYYVPVDTLQSAICAAANRGVDVSLILPARNDDFAVGATCKGYYEDLLIAGVSLFEYQPGLLHTKSMTVDDEVTLIGSANMDRRSFDLNFENNILLSDPEVTAVMLERQKHYIADSRPVDLAEVQSWNWAKRLWHNTLAIVGPVL